MISIPQIDLSKYKYVLPKEKIAEVPLMNRDGSKLLVSKKSNAIQEELIDHSLFRNISEYLPDNSLIFINDTKVLPARLLMQKETGGRAELFLLEPISPSSDPQIILNTKNNCRWECMVGGKKIKEQSKLVLHDSNLTFEAEIVSKNGNIALCDFFWENGKTFGEMLEEIGKIPLPPYIKRELTNEDKINYQTVYSQYKGSVAAPTAGLHFTDDILESLKLNNEILNLTLHVGAGTFLPISSENINEHLMHKEQIFIKKDRIKSIINYLKKYDNVIATGTTSVRTLESLYWLGKRMYYKDFTLSVSQWEPYDNQFENISVIKSLSMILEYMDKNEIGVLNFNTDIIIVPSYEFKIIKGMITNFHQPESTLILLVAAFLGYDLWKKVYSEALNNDYRFLSYGDSSLLLS